jgi:hypothetical protein
VFTNSDGVELYGSRNYKEYNSSNNVVTIPRSLMTAGTVKVTLTIKNFLGETSTDTTTIKVVDEKRIMLFFDKGIGNTVYYSKKADFPVITTIGCSQTTDEDPEYSWRFIPTAAQTAATVDLSKITKRSD